MAQPRKKGAGLEDQVGLRRRLAETDDLDPLFRAEAEKPVHEGAQEPEAVRRASVIVKVERNVLVQQLLYLVLPG